MNDLDRLIAMNDIRQLAERYAVYLDARDLDKLVELYLPDVFVRKDRRGREALRADFDQSLRGVGVTFLHVGNHVIDFDGDDKANGIQYTRGEIQDGGLHSKRWIIHLIQYHDTYEKHEGRWLFARRKHLLVAGSELGVNPLSLSPADWPNSQTGMGSVPHSLASWRAFWGLDGEG